MDNLIVQQKEGVDIKLRNFRYALYRMHARALGHKGKGARLGLANQARG